MRRAAGLGAAAACLACLALALGTVVPPARAAAPTSPQSAHPGASPSAPAAGTRGARAAPPAADWGPASDVAAIREIELGIDQQLIDPLASVTGVTVARGYALVGWKTPQGSGQSLYCRTTLGWNRIATGGGRFDVVELVGSGVPSRTVEAMKARVPGGLAGTSGMRAARFHRLTGRCL